MFNISVYLYFQSSEHIILSKGRKIQRFQLKASALPNLHPYLKVQRKNNPWNGTYALLPNITFDSGSNMERKLLVKALDKLSVLFFVDIFRMYMVDIA